MFCICGVIQVDKQKNKMGNDFIQLTGNDDNSLDFNKSLLDLKPAAFWINSSYFSLSEFCFSESNLELDSSAINWLISIIFLEIDPLLKSTPLVISKLLALDTLMYLVNGKTLTEIMLL